MEVSSNLTDKAFDLYNSGHETKCGEMLWRGQMICINVQILVDLSEILTGFPIPSRSF